MKRPPRTPLHADAPHESAFQHVSGRARYVDDLAEPHGCLTAFILTSPHPHARIVSRDASRARLPGVHGIFFAQDIPGNQHIGPIGHDEPVLAEDRVFCVGQAVALIVADDEATCRAAAALVDVAYEALPALCTIDEAVAAGAFIGETHTIARGDLADAFTRSTLIVDTEVRSGGQDHFYLETQVSLAIPQEQGCMRVISSTQHPTEVQVDVAQALAIGRHQVVVEQPRMGGAFGGKESQASNLAVLAAVAASKLNRPVKLWFDRGQDMVQTGKRHPFRSIVRAGFDADGVLLAFDVDIVADGGWVTDLSPAIVDRALFHLDSSYFIEACRFVGRVARTHTVSNTAFRGFGGPQGMLVVDQVLTEAAERLGIDPAEIRRRNYYGDAPRDRAPYGQTITHNRLARVTEELLAEANYARRRAQIDAFNRAQPHVRRGLGFQPVKFGISFTNSLLNQAGALVLLYTDGTVQLNHGGTEMGQGLHTKMRAVCAHELGLEVAEVRVMTTATDKVPNTSATAASSGSDLNGQAVRNACLTLKERLQPVVCEMLGVPSATPLVFAGGRIAPIDGSGPGVSVAEAAARAWATHVSLAATGYYATPGIGYDRSKGRGTPFYYYAYGGSVVEVEVSVLTGEYRLRRVDVLHDVGNPLVPSIDVGQVEGGFMQGFGWLSMEELVWRDGHLLTHGASTYKIPAAGDAPEDFRVRLLERAPQPGVIHGSKAVGEPPFMLAIGFVTALRHAIASLGPPGRAVHLEVPCTPEAVLRAVVRQQT